MLAKAETQVFEEYKFVPFLGIVHALLCKLNWEASSRAMFTAEGMDSRLKQQIWRLTPQSAVDRYLESAMTLAPYAIHPVKNRSQIYTLSLSTNLIPPFCRLLKQASND